MHRNQLLGLLLGYESFDREDVKTHHEYQIFVKTQTNCFDRALLIGHVTGSAFIINTSKTKTLLIHHAKLNRWLQPGGHADGNPDIAAVALKEAQEETGLAELKIIDHKIFDLDIHTIPERKGVPEHLHYDARFLIFANENEPFTKNHESHDIQWVALKDIEKYTNEESIMRMVKKVNFQI